MKQGYLSEYFQGVAVKKLSAVEANLVVSNQHEFNGVQKLKELLGNERKSFNTKFIYLNDGEDDPVSDTGEMTWYDARENNPTRSEWRLYFPTTRVSQCAAEGDTLVIGKLIDGTLLTIIAEKASTIENQILWLLGVSEKTSLLFTVKDALETEQDRIQFASRIILEKIGIQPQEEDDNLLDIMLDRFNGSFPATIDFSAFARSTIKDISSLDNPDTAIVLWMQREEILFRTLEKHLVAERLQQGFGGSVDDFFFFSLSAINRRKSRAGSALENHVEFMLKEHNIRYTRTPITENKSKPDFVFPGIDFYRNLEFPNTHLTMLGVKTTCKDRWRQVCTEAARIDKKHLLTLEPRISEYQTNEMHANNVQLVIPQEIKNTYSNSQKISILNIGDFLQLVQAKQLKIKI